MASSSRRTGRSRPGKRRKRRRSRPASSSRRSPRRRGRSSGPRSRSRWTAARRSGYWTPCAQERRICKSGGSPRTSARRRVAVTSRRTGSALAVLVLVLVSGSARAAAEVELSATLDTDTVALDGTVTLQVTATYSSKGEPGDLIVPGLADFDLVSRQQSEQVSFAFVNGAPSFHRTIVTSLALTPKRSGDLTIEPVKLDYHGHTYATQPLKVHVLAAGQAPPSRAQNKRGASSPFAGLGEPPPDDLDPFADVHPGQRDLLLRAAVDNERPFVGQQITYSLYLLARINVSGIDKLQLPRLDGFWTEEIEAPQQLVGEARILDGVPYRSFLLRKRALSKK